jgi:uncharacterized protein (TIGR02266 family)
MATPQDKRKHNRVRTNLHIAAKQMRRATFGAAITNLSEGGAFIATGEKLSRGDEVMLFLNVSIGGEQKSCMLQGKVAWANTQVSKGTLGAGIAFNALPPAMARILRDYLAQDRGGEISGVGTKVDDEPKPDKPTPRGTLRG